MWFPKPLLNSPTKLCNYHNTEINVTIVPIL